MWHYVRKSTVSTVRSALFQTPPSSSSSSSRLLAHTRRPAPLLPTVGLFAFTMADQDPPPQHEGGPQDGPPPGSIAIPIPLGPNGERPTPEQIQQIQMQLAAEAQKHGISIQEYVQRLRQQAMAQQMQQQQMQQQQQQPIQPGPPKPEALAVANWLKSQDLKPRTVVHDEKRKDMFRGSHAPSPAVLVAMPRWC